MKGIGMEGVSMTGRLDNVQALRGIACLMVVGFHLWGWDDRFGAHTPVVGAFRWFGFAGVDLFFVLSGFIITLTNLKNVGRPTAVPGYLFRRLWRIYPAYWAAFVAAAIAGWLTVGWPIFSDELASAYPVWLSLFPSPRENAVLGVSWTLTYEVMFYIVFGLLMVLPARGLAVALGAWAAVVAVAQCYPESNTLARYLVAPFVLEFLAGCLVAGLIAHGVTRHWRAALVLAGVTTAGGIAVVSLTHTLPFEGVMADSRTRVFVWGLPAALTVYGFVAAEKHGFARPPRWLLAVGDASYAIYLTHFPVMIATVVLAMQLPRTKLLHYGWAIGTVALCVAVGLNWYRWVEKPLLGLIARKKPAIVPIPAVTAVPARRAA